MRDYALLRESLLDDLKVRDCMLTSDASIESANRLWLQNSFWKKFQDEIGVDADANCLKLFKDSNERCRNFVLSPQSVQDEEVIGEVKSLWWDLVGNGPESNLQMTDILGHCGVGPGANTGARSFNEYSKLFDSPLTGTSERLYRFFRYSILESPTWHEAEKLRESRYGHRIVVGNRLSYVPKTSEVSRSTCTEPTLNMFLQKGIGFVLEKWLKRAFSIDLSSQPDINRRLARQGSVDGLFGTIDLSSASDTISLKMLQEILPAELLNWLELARSPSVIYPDGTVSELYMVSSMGNGFTFPLETLLFATIVVACYRVLGIKSRIRREGPANWAVFGDDIIVQKDSYDFVIRALRMFGFVPNDQKSFNTGDFRESCGGDYFRGHDIRGVYCKSLQSGADIYSTINRLVRWSARTGILLPKTVSTLRAWVKHLPIPVHDGDAEGVKVPYAPAELKVDRHTGAKYYYALVKQPKSIRMPLQDDQVRRYRHYGRIQEIGYNPGGLLVSLVRGVIRNGRVGVRDDPEKDTFKIRRRMTNRWTEWTLQSQVRNHLEYLASTQPHESCVMLPVGPRGLDYDWVVIAEMYGL